MDNTVYSDELQHHGIRGMRWGVRRYQNKDGSLTPAGEKRYNKEMEALKKETAKVKAEEKAAATRRKTQAKIDKLEAKKQELEERKKALRDEKKGKKSEDDSSDKPTETLEEKRERLLKSTDPKELYKGKDALSYQELNERVNRIDLEARLQSRIVEEHKKTGMEYVTDVKNNIDKATNLFRSVDNAYSAVMNSAIGKTIADKLGIEAPKKTFDLDKVIRNIDSVSSQDAMDYNKKLLALNSARKAKKDLDDAIAADKKATDDAKAATKAEKEAEKRQKEAQKQVDDYNSKWKSGKSDDKVTSDTYSYKNENLSNARDTVKTLLLENKMSGTTSSNTKTAEQGKNTVFAFLEGPGGEMLIPMNVKEIKD